MTQQRIPVLLCFLLPAVVGCGGGDGTPIEAVDPDAPPVLSDKQPPTITNQNPVNPASVPPDNTQDPPADPSVPVTNPPPGGGGGSCVDDCNALPARGCQTPEEGCEQACRPDPMQPCSREELALLRCASEIICPEDVQAQLQQVVAHCPNQYDAHGTCVLNSAGTD